MRNPMEIPREWINTDDELPPKDGWYWCSNHPDQLYDLGSCYYDGFGFESHIIYRNVKFWAHMVSTEKKYGKIVE